MPRAVRASSLLLGVTAGLAVVMTVLSVVAWWHLGPAGEAYSRASLEAGYGDGDGWPRAVLSSLVYNTVTTGMTALITGLLAVMIRQPLRWVQVTTWCVVAAVCAALGCGLNAGPDPAGSTASSDSSQFQRLGYDLVPQWYPSVNAVLGLALLAAAIGAAVMLLRSPVQDFYRPASSREDPRWSSFVQRQAERSDSAED
ncbi:MAG: hypothetical protein ABW000_13175 [Actinoplanes sp.]